MAKYYCKYCGQSFSSINSLTAYQCNRHPDGRGMHHELYEGEEKSQYTCKYCGLKFNSLTSLTAYQCNRHPDGRGNHHEPAL